MSLLSLEICNPPRSIRVATGERHLPRRTVSAVWSLEEAESVEKEEKATEKGVKLLMLLLKSEDFEQEKTMVD